jgi:hypothetical protein
VEVVTEISEMLACLKRIERLMDELKSRTALIDSKLAQLKAIAKKPEWADTRDFDPETLARLEADDDDEPPDTKNAAIQGGEV